MQKDYLCEERSIFYLVRTSGKNHQLLDYLSPAEYTEKVLVEIHSPVLPMWSASTAAFFGSVVVILRMTIKGKVMREKENRC